jgi:hypothetical protein
MHGRGEKCIYKVLVGKPEGKRDNWKHLGIDGRII